MISLNEFLQRLPAYTVKDLLFQRVGRYHDYSNFSKGPVRFVRVGTTLFTLMDLTGKKLQGWSTERGAGSMVVERIRVIGSAGVIVLLGKTL